MSNKRIGTVITSLPLLNEPATAKDRRLCLRQVEENKWCVCFYSEPDDEFQAGKYYKTLIEAQECFQAEVSRYMTHYQELVDLFYESERV